MPRSVITSTGELAPTTTKPAQTLIHASCVQVDGFGIVLLGPSGAGKSDFALRLIDAGALLVADDQLQVESSQGGLLGRPAEALAGLLEVRGIGILRVPYCPECRLDLVVALDSAKARIRMPEPAFYEILGARLRLLHLDPLSASADAKLRLALRAEQVD